MKYRKAVEILTAVSAALCVYALSMALWYSAHGETVSAILDFFAFAITLSGSVFGALWLCERWKDEE